MFIIVFHRNRWKGKVIVLLSEIDRAWSWFASSIAHVYSFPVPPLKMFSQDQFYVVKWS
jgi:hypothetical protein